MSLKQSTVVIYKSTGILPEKNFIIDDIEDYLTSFTSTTISNVQYFKHALDTFVKLDYSQELQEFLASNDYNYMSITNDDGKTCYYFIIGKAVLGQSTIQFRLRMDTCNTFLPGTDFTINDKTKIKRQHRDRYKRVSLTTLYSNTYTVNPRNYDSEKEMYYYILTISLASLMTYIPIVILSFSDTVTRTRDLEYSVDTSTGTLTVTVWDENTNIVDTVSVLVRYASTLRRVIDPYHEGLNPVLYKKSSEQILAPIDTSWNLVYQTENDALRCFLVPDAAYGTVSVSIPPTTFTIDTSTLTGSGYYYLVQLLQPNDEYQVTPSDASGIMRITRKPYNYYTVLEMYNNGTYIEWRYLKMNLNSAEVEELASGTTATSVVCYLAPSYIYYYFNSTQLTTFAQIYAITSATGSFDNTGSTSYESACLADVDRTDSTLVKIIKLPYSPTYIDDEGNVSGGWSVNQNLISGKYTLSLIVSDADIKFKAAIDNDVESPFSPFFVDTVPLLTDTRSIDNESKLYHSDFYQPKLVYDSFNFTFQLDKEDYTSLASIYTGTLQLDFIATSTINSRFAFMMPEVLYSYSTEDYDNVLNIARNNEVVLYTSAYLDYIRTGFNYDVKSKQRSEIGTIASTVGSIITFGVGAATGNAAAVVSGFLGLTSSIIQGANSIAQQEANVEQRIAQAKAQAWSVSGADDIDLLEAYSNNRASLNIYEVSDRLKNALYDVFFYTGYATDEQGIPDMTSRYRFNFVACDLVVTGNNNIPDDIDSDLKARYSEGVTFIHNLDGVWDTEQVYENWETSLGGDS